MDHLSWLEVNLKNIGHNLRQYRKIIGPNKLLIPIVKSNAYGHGLVEVSKFIIQTKTADKLGVVSGAEALELRHNKITAPLLILSFWTQSQALALQSTKTEFVVYNFRQIKDLAKLKKQIKIHLKIDTGNNRLGFYPDQIKAVVRKIRQYKNLNITGVFTHYANSEEDNSYTRKQTERLINVKNDLEKMGIKALYHASSSAAVLSNPQNLFDGLRLGISLYGLWPSDFSKIQAAQNYPKLNIKPALTWNAKIIALKTVSAGDFIGYGCSYLARKTMKIAVLPIGYYDGYDRKFSNCGTVLIHNKLCPVVGRVCMNLIMIDVSKVKNIKLNTSVIIFGNKLPVEELAQKINTLNYEIIARINPLLPRIYQK